MLDQGLTIIEDSFVLIVVFSGVGKSTFINCLRGLEAEDQGSASVGVVETTNQPTPYEHPDFPNLKIWDLPGTNFSLQIF